MGRAKSIFDGRKKMGCGTILLYIAVAFFIAFGGAYYFWNSNFKYGKLAAIAMIVLFIYTLYNTAKK